MPAAIAKQLMVLLMKMKLKELPHTRMAKNNKYPSMCRYM